MRTRSIVLGFALLVSLPRLGLCLLGVGDVSVVTDPGAIEQAVKEVQGIQQQIQQQKQLIEDQLKIWAQGAQNLTATPLNLVNQLTTLMKQYDDALATVKGVPYTIDAAKAQWDSLFSAPTQSQGLPGKVQALAAAMQQAGAQANQMQSVYTRLQTQVSSLQAALLASKTAPGALAAQQAQTQVTGVLSDQLDTLTKITLTEARAHTLQMADDARTSAQSATNSANWIQGFTDPQNMPVGFGKGNGPRLD